ncbi:MAG TPA: TadE/TadG family type IV pilus assembly protein [Acidimicrobiales bacterium]
MSALPRRRRLDRGQATVELVLVLPLVFALVLAVAQVAVVARAHVLVGAAARDAARAAAVGDVAGARQAALDGSGLDPARTEVDVDVGATVVTARVRYRDPTTVPIVGRLVGDVTVGATVVMRRER